MKKIAAHAGLFVGVFLIATIIMFPYALVVGSVLDQQIKKNNIPMQYKSITSSIFKTTLHGVTVNYGNNIDLGDFYVKYSPLSVFTKGVKAGVSSPYGIAEASHSSNKLKLNATIDLFRATKLFNQQAEGELNLNVAYDLKSKNGTFYITSGAFAVQTPMMRLVGDNITGTGTIADNVLTITSLEAQGQSGLKATGRITIDKENTKRSLINISGEANMMGMKSKFVVRGTIGSPQFALQ